MRSVKDHLAARRFTMPPFVGRCLGVGAALGMAFLVFGCASFKAYWVDRGRDALDPFSLGVDVGLGASVQAGPLMTGLIGAGGGWGLQYGTIGPYDHFEFQLIVVGLKVTEGGLPDRPKCDNGGQIFLLSQTHSTFNGMFGGEAVSPPTPQNLGNIEVHLALGLGVRAGISLFEAVDFLGGWVGLDPMGDDIARIKSAFAPSGKLDEAWLTEQGELLLRLGKEYFSVPVSVLEEGARLAEKGASDWDQGPKRKRAVCGRHRVDEKKAMAMRERSRPIPLATDVAAVRDNALYLTPYVSPETSQTVQLEEGVDMMIWPVDGCGAGYHPGFFPWGCGAFLSDGRRARTLQYGVTQYNLVRREPFAHGRAWLTFDIIRLDPSN